MYEDINFSGAPEALSEQVSKELFRWHYGDILVGSVPFTQKFDRWTGPTKK